MTTSKRTTRGAGSRPDNGAATPSAPPQSAAPPNAPSSAPAKARVRQRKSPSSPAAARASDKTSSHSAAAQAPHPDRYASIAQAAYFRSQHRGFKPGHEMEDWLAAEAEVDQRLRGESRSSGDSAG